jgi:hypothetical protein
MDMKRLWAIGLFWLAMLAGIMGIFVGFVMFMSKALGQ